MFDQLVAATCGTSEAQAADAWTRVESAACARRLAAMVTMLDTAHAADGSADRDQWCLDNWGAVCAHIGAAQRLTSGAASGLLLVGTALRDHYPKVGAVFSAGLIGYPLVRAIVSRSTNVTDPAARRLLDAALAKALQTWGPMSQDKTQQTIDAFVERFDPLAVRRTNTSARSRSMDVVIEDGSGLASLFCTLFATDAKAFEARVAVLADTVCTSDPRTADQRRADAVGALAHGADRLTCLCETENCPTAISPAPSGVVVYVVAHRDTITPPHCSDKVAPRDVVPAPDEAVERTEASAKPDTDTDTVDEPAVETETETETETDEYTGLDGVPPPRFSKPLRNMTLTEVMARDDRGRLSSIRPGALMGGQLLPGAVTRRAALNATLVTIIHPGQATPESHYAPSKKLADFVRCRDLACRFPGCAVPATNCDVDHTIPWPCGPTQASNLKCLCRKHHLLKTFWTGWQDRQFPDGTVEWTAPDGRTHRTAPGSRLLFPELCQPTAPAIVRSGPTARHTVGLTMPRRRTSRAQDRARRIDYERGLNRAAAVRERADAAPPF